MITSLKDCDKGFMDRVKGCMIEDEDGNLVQVPVLYMNPDEEETIEDYPAFVVMRMGAYPDTSRWTNNISYTDPTYNNQGELVDVAKHEAPQPFAIYYSVRMYYQYPQDGAVMSLYIMQRFHRGAYLEIDKVPYDLSYVSYRNPQTSYKEFGETKDKEINQYLEQYQFRLDVDLAPVTKGRVKISRETDFNIDTK